MLAAVEERSCTTAQEFDVGSSGAEEILLSQVVPRITSCQQIGSKVVVKGEMDISALIRAADAGKTPGRATDADLETVMIHLEKEAEG